MGLYGIVTNLSKVLNPARALLCLLLALLLYLGYRYTRARFFAPISFDEEFFVWYGSLMTQGSVPYRDFFEPKPLVIFFANCVGLEFFGYSGFLFRIVPTFLALAAIAVFYLALLRRNIVSWLAALLTAQVAFWLLGPEMHDSGLNDTETYGFSFTLLGFSLGSLSGSIEVRWEKFTLQVLSGVCFGLAVFSKELFVFSVGPAWVFVAFNRQNVRWDWLQLLFSAAGAIAVAVASLLYLVNHSAFGPYLDLISFYRSFAANYAFDIGRFPRVSGFSVLAPSWAMLHGVLYNFRNLAFVLVLWLGLIVLIRRGANTASKKVQLAVALFAVVLGMFAVSVGYCFWVHYFLMGTMGLVLLSVLSADALSVFLSEKSGALSVITLVVLAGCLCFVGYDATKVVLEKPATYQPRGWDPLLVQTIDRHSKSGDYILTTEGPLLYVDMNRKGPLGINAFLDEMLPYLSANNNLLKIEALRAGLEKNLPKVCYFPDWLRPRQAKYRELLFDPLLAKHRYVKVTDSLWYLPEEK